MRWVGVEGSCDSSWGCVWGPEAQYPKAEKTVTPDLASLAGAQAEGTGTADAEPLPWKRQH